MKKHFWLVLIFLLALILRVIFISKIPSGFTADEAAQGYTAYSILHTGRDEWGVRFPINPRSFGDYKAPLYTYICIPFVAVLGLNEFAVRLPNALLGSLAVILVYFLVKLLFSSMKEKEDGIWAEKVAFWSVFLLAVSPWHVSLSRGAFEANLTVFFLPVAIILFLAGFKKNQYFILSAIFFGLNLFTYHSAKLITPLVLLSLIIWQKRRLNIKNKKEKLYLICSTTIFILFLGTAFLSIFRGAGTRVSDIGIFSGGWQEVADNRFFEVNQGLPDNVARLFNNKATFIFSNFIKNYISYLTLEFLFTKGAGEATYGMIPGRGVLYLIELVFVLFGLYYSVKEKKSAFLWLFIWVLLSPVPAALSKGVGYHANRVAIMMPAIIIISAFGLVKIFELLKNKVLVKIIVVFVLISVINFIQAYFYLSSKNSASKMSYGWRQAVDYLKTLDAAKQVVISRTFSEPQAFIMFYEKVNPDLVQEQTLSWLKYEKEGKFFVDQLGTYNLGRYEFRNFAFPEDWLTRDRILVGNEKDFLIQKDFIEKNKQLGLIKTEKIIKNPDNSIAFMIYTTSP